MTVQADTGDTPASSVVASAENFTVTDLAAALGESDRVDAYVLE